MAVHTSFRSFDLALQRYGTDKVPEFMRGRLTVIALEMARQLTQMTPVDTGRLKGNWQFTVGDPAEGAIDRISGSPVGTADGASQADVLTRMPGWKPGNWIWFHNGVPYAKHVNDGTPKVPARLMVERTAEHIKRWLKI